jgi:hypothetical protein
MGFRNAVNIIGDIINRNDTYYIISKGDMDDMGAFVGMIVVHFEALEKEEDVPRGDDDLLIVHRALDVCKRTVLNHVITDKVKDLVNNTCILAHNWNNNIGNDAKLEGEVRLLDTLVQQHFTIGSAIDVLKSVLEQVRHSASSVSDVGLISRHYLEALDAINAEGDSCEEDRCI